MSTEENGPPLDPEMIRRAKEMAELVRQSGAFERMQQVLNEYGQSIQEAVALAGRPEFKGYLEYARKMEEQLMQMPPGFLSELQRHQEELPVGLRAAAQAASEGAGLPPISSWRPTADADHDDVRRLVAALERRVAELESRLPHTE